MRWRLAGRPKDLTQEAEIPGRDRRHRVPDPAASLAAGLGVLALKIAHTRGTDPSGKQEPGA